NPLGEYRNLLLLEYHRNHALVVHGLQIEGPVSRLPYGPGHEAVGCAEDVNCAGHGILQNTGIGVSAVIPRPALNPLSRRPPRLLAAPHRPCCRLPRRPSAAWPGVRR